jgi:uncharacterized protein (TIGR02270 family)
MTLLAGAPEAAIILQTVVETRGERAEHALQLLMRRWEPQQARAWLMRIAARSDTMRAAVVGAGALGDPELADWLIGSMENPELARLAGEALRMITGLDTSSESIRTVQPQGFVAGPSDDPEDSVTDTDPDEHLPWPDPDAIRRWWDVNRDGFRSGTRYFLGRPCGADWLREILRKGTQRERAGAALELAIRQPATPLFEVRAPAFRQQRLLGST